MKFRLIESFDVSHILNESEDADDYVNDKDVIKIVLCNTNSPISDVPQLTNTLTPKSDDNPFNTKKIVRIGDNFIMAYVILVGGNYATTHADLSAMLDNKVVNNFGMYLYMDAHKSPRGDGIIIDIQPEIALENEAFKNTVEIVEDMIFDHFGVSSYN